MVVVRLERDVEAHIQDRKRRTHEARLDREPDELREQRRGVREARVGAVQVVDHERRDDDVVQRRSTEPDLSE